MDKKKEGGGREEKKKNKWKLSTHVFATDRIRFDWLRRRENETEEKNRLASNNLRDSSLYKKAYNLNNFSVHRFNCYITNVKKKLNGFKKKKFF